MCALSIASKDIILVSGFHIHPNEVEAVIAEHPAVVEVAVVDIPDERTSEALWASLFHDNPI